MGLGGIAFGGIDGSPTISVCTSSSIVSAMADTPPGYALCVMQVNLNAACRHRIYAEPRSEPTKGDRNRRSGLPAVPGAKRRRRHPHRRRLVIGLANQGNHDLHLVDPVGSSEDQD